MMHHGNTPARSYRTHVYMGLVTVALKAEGIGHMPTDDERRQVEQARKAGRAWTEVRDELVAARRRAHHGGPYDRGSADAWYARPRRPHYFEGATYQSREVPEAEMTPEQVAAYHAGYDAGPYNGKGF